MCKLFIFNVLHILVAQIRLSKRFIGKFVHLKELCG